MVDFFAVFLRNLQTIGLADILDILIVTILVFSVIKFVRETRAVNLIKGLAFLVVIMYISGWLKLNSVNFILAKTLEVGLIAIIIVFQPELRRALEKMGNSSISRIIYDSDTDCTPYSDAVSEASKNLSATKTGALIVIEKEVKLSAAIDSGIEMNAEITRELLENIFVPKSPLHDGAVIISEGKIRSAASVLPLSTTTEISSKYGTRHRAAIGISEISDCIAVVVSEETGKISVAKEGALKSNLTPEELKAILVENEVDKEEEKSTKDKLLDWLVKKR
ncbi:MAG: TIGR00159 family protein [Ruminococcaceae bacterium]|nr:TIGR00159 family protein [Oscillospiraceae bacterium]